MELVWMILFFILYFSVFLVFLWEDFLLGFLFFIFLKWHQHLLCHQWTKCKFNLPKRLVQILLWRLKKVKRDSLLILYFLNFLRISDGISHARCKLKCDLG